MRQDRNCSVKIFGHHGRVLRSDAVLRAILDAVNRTVEITSIASDIELFVQEYEQFSRRWYAARVRRSDQKEASPVYND